MDGSPSNPGMTESIGPRAPVGRVPDEVSSLDPKPRVRNSRSRQRADTKERIFESALREFREVGFAGAQIDRIAKKAGIARGTFYFHFPTKDDVMLELARRINARGSRRVALMAEAEPDLQAFFTGFIDILIDEFGRVSDAGLNAELLALYVRRPYDLAEPLHNAPTITDEFSGYLRRLSERGEFRLTTTPDQLSIIIMSSLFGILARVPRNAGVREACHSLVDLLVKGLQSEE